MNELRNEIINQGLLDIGPALNAKEKLINAINGRKGAIVEDFIMFSNQTERDKAIMSGVESGFNECLKLIKEILS